MSRGLCFAPGPRVSPRYLRQDDRDPYTWEQRQDERLENLFGALVVTLGERVQERMAEAAGCSPTGVAALHWIDRGRCLRSCDLVEALALSSPGGSQVVQSLIAAGLVERRRYTHDRRQWALSLTELGRRRMVHASSARARAVRDLVVTLPFPWRLRLIRILERLLARMVVSRQSVLQLCRHCDWDRCRGSTIESCIEPCPVALAYAERRTSSRLGRGLGDPPEEPP